MNLSKRFIFQIKSQSFGKTFKIGNIQIKKNSLILKGIGDGEKKLN